MTPPTNLRSSRIHINFFGSLVDKALRGPLSSTSPTSVYEARAHTRTHTTCFRDYSPVSYYFCPKPEKGTTPRLRRSLPRHHRYRVTITASHRPGKDVHYQLMREVRPRVMKYTWLAPPWRTDAKKTCVDETVAESGGLSSRIYMEFLMLTLEKHAYSEEQY